MATIDVGDLYRLSYDHKSPAGDPVTAGTMTVTITRDWDGTTTTPVTVTPGSIGAYVHDYLTGQPGRHVASWVGTGANPGTYSDVFYVLPAASQALISPADARHALTSTDAAAAAMAAHDDELRLFVEAATGAVERHLGEVVARRSITEFHPLSHRSVPSLVCRSVPVISVTSLATVDGARTWDVAGLHLDPTTGEVTALSGAWFSGHLRLVYTAGHQVIPAHYVLGTRIILQHLWSTQRGSRGTPRPGGMGAPLALGMGFAVPNAAIELLGPGMSGMA